MAESQHEDQPPPDPSLQDIIASASQRLNYPSADKLYAWLRQHGHVVSRAQINKFTKEQAVRQIFHQPREATADKQGKITAVSLHERWMADLIDLSSQPSSNNKISGGGSSASTYVPEQPFRYILVVQNVFSRELYARPLQTKDAKTVTEAFETILDDNFHPGRLDTDNGPEFQGLFGALLKKEGITHVVKDPQDKNALGTIDRAIQLLKQALFRRMVAEHNHDWKALLSAVVDGMNETVHSELHGRVPEQVEVDDVLQFHLRQEASENLLRNHKIIEARGRKLLHKGAFRPADAQRYFQRSFQPKFSNNVHAVAEIEGANVIDDSGRSYATKRVLAVPASSQSIASGAAHGLCGGSLLAANLRKVALRPVAHQLEAFVGSDTLPLARVVAKMKELGMDKIMTRAQNYKTALELLGFEVRKRPNNKYSVIGKGAPNSVALSSHAASSEIQPKRKAKILA